MKIRTTRRNLRVSFANTIDDKNDGKIIKCHYDIRHFLCV